MKVFYVALVFFLILGLLMTGFQIYLGITDFGGYFVSVFGFILFPIFMIYGLTYGFSRSEKATIDSENRRDKFSFDDDGIKLVMPIFDVTLKTSYNNIKEIIFRMTDDYDEYVIYFKGFAEIEHNKNPWFLNRIFPYKNNRKEIYIKSDCKGFNQVSIMKAKYLPGLTLKK